MHEKDIGVEQTSWSSWGRLGESQVTAALVVQATEKEKQPKDRIRMREARNRVVMDEVNCEIADVLWAEKVQLPTNCQHFVRVDL